MRAVLFDLGNTLVSYYAAADFAPVLRACLRTCVSVLPAEVETDESELERRALELNRERKDHAVWPLEERLKILFGGFAADPATLKRLATAFLQPIFGAAVVDPQARPVLAALRSRGLRVAIVSNTPWGSSAEDWRTELARHGLLAAVDAAVFCVDVGYRKPHPAPIERALALLDVPAAEAVFVGDDPRWDVAGAQAAGVQPILLSKKTTPAMPEGVAVATDLRQIQNLVS